MQKVRVVWPAAVKSTLTAHTSACKRGCLGYTFVRIGNPGD
ncbi:hypothetical protein [Hoylesella shahii]|nr:hypothetical protein [Hoylesella shahii]